MKTLHLKKVEKKLGKIKYRLLLKKEIATLGYNPDHYDFRDNEAIIKVLENSIKYKNITILR